MATKRAFYISASRTREHVQVYTDGTQKWVDAVKRPEGSIKTAHDALKPETERKQARLIWAMGQPVSKTAIGRAWSRHEGVDGHRLSARVIPATKRFPQPALALPLYDNNGKTAGLALVSLVAGNDGRLTQGVVRMVATEGATGAVLQRSESGNTQVVKDLAGAIKALQDHPRDGVVWQTGDARPSPWMLKVSKGTEQAVDAARAQSVRDNMDSMIVPPVLPAKHEPDMRTAVISARETLDLQRQAGEELASRHAQTLNKPAEPENIIIPAQLIPDLTVIPPEATRSPEHRTVDKDTLARIAAAVLPEPEVRPDISQIELPDRAKDLQNLSRTAEHVAGELAERKRAEVTLPPTQQERGRTLEHEELTRTHTIQKER